MTRNQPKPDPLNTFRVVIGGKDYDGGNYVYVFGRHVYIEFDSDYTIHRQSPAKNWRKQLAKWIEAIPNPVDLDWLLNHGWTVPLACYRKAGQI